MCQPCFTRYIFWITKTMFISRLSMIVRVNVVWIGLSLLLTCTVSDVSTTCAVVIFRSQGELVVCQLSHDVGYEDSQCHWRVSIPLLSQFNSLIVGCPVVLLKLILLDYVNKSFVPCRWLLTMIKCRLFLNSAPYCYTRTRLPSAPRYEIEQ